MQLFHLVALLATLATLVQAGSVSIPLRRRHSGRVKGGVLSYDSLQAELTKTRVKYGLQHTQDRRRAGLGSVPLHVEEDFAGEDRRRAVSSINLQEETGDASYYAPMTIGGSSYNIVLDTGSSDLVVASTGCNSCDSDVPLYNPASSSTATTTTTSFSITYGTGSASGTLVSDSVSMGDFNIASQTFAACTTFDNLLSGSESGLLGLGWKTLSTSGATPFVQALYEAGDLTNPVFGLGFNEQEGGTLTLGDVDTEATAGDLNYVPLVDTGSYWSVPLDDVRVNGVSVGVSSSSVIIDSGTSLISLPAAAVASVYSAVSSESVASGELMLYPCATNVTISLSFGGVYYDVPNSEFSYGNVDDENSQCYGIVYDASEGTSDSTYIIGAAFLQHVYSAYRFSEPAVGFANLAGNAATPVESSTSAVTSSTAESTTILSTDISGLASTIVESESSTSSEPIASTSPTDTYTSSIIPSASPTSSGFASIVTTASTSAPTEAPSSDSIAPSISAAAESAVPSSTPSSGAVPRAQAVSGLLVGAGLLAVFFA